MSEITERRLEEKERRRIEILDAAETVAGVVGVEALTMDLVARKARLSRALLYVYFHDKSALLLALCVRALDALHARFEAATASHPVGMRQVVACGRAYVAFAEEFPARFEALAHVEAQQPSGDHDPAYDAFLAAGDRTHGTICAAIERGMQDGSIRPEAGPPSLIGLTLWGLMHGLIQLSITKSGSLEREGVGREQLIEQGFSLAAESLATDAGRAALRADAVTPDVSTT
jgi:AcrR family transcriptional regulator